MTKDIDNSVDKLLNNRYHHEDCHDGYKHSNGTVEGCSCWIRDPKQALFDLINEVVIGENTKAIYINKAPLNTDEIKAQAKFRADVLNRERAEQRARLKEIFKGVKNGTN